MGVRRLANQRPPRRFEVKSDRPGHRRALNPAADTALETSDKDEAKASKTAADLRIASVLRQVGGGVPGD
jgi:hypothetical protein